MRPGIIKVLKLLGILCIVLGVLSIIVGMSQSVVVSLALLTGGAVELIVSGILIFAFGALIDAIYDLRDMVDARVPRK